MAPPARPSIFRRNLAGEPALAALEIGGGAAWSSSLEGSASRSSTYGPWGSRYLATCTNP
jgi:hypothetical protein